MLWWQQHKQVISANAELTQRAGRHRIYTDGATIPGERTGWGFTVISPAEEEVIACAGRLRGDQSNDIAEAMALLQALQSIHLHTEVDIYIDNTGVLDTSKVNLQQDPRARSQQTARAVWNRIMPILRERDTRGTHTALHWIHSHTDDEERRRWKTNARYQCACGGQGKQECDPNHKHHIGNERADALAKEGMRMDCSTRAPEYTPQLHRLAGEEEYHLIDLHGGVCQGSVRKFLDTCANRIELARMRDEGNAGKHANDYFYTAWQESSSPIRKKVTQSKAVSLRFRMRLWTNTLPTYDRIGKMAEGVGVYKEVYGDTIRGGECPWCPGRKETMKHIVQHCPKYAITRAKLLQAAKDLWEKAKHDWLELEWLTDRGAARYNNWERQWGWEGLVPEEALRKAYQCPQSARHVHSLMNATAVHMIQGAWTIWEERNAAKEQWEEETGIKVRKHAAQKKRWQPAPYVGPTRKRGRPRLELHELKSKATIQKRKMERDLEQFQDSLGEDEGQRRFNLWKRDGKVRNRLQAASHGSAVAPLKLQKVSRIQRQGPQPAPIQEQVPAGAVCDVNTCQETAVKKGWGCTKESWRCKAHDYMLCKGSGWMNSPTCDCQLNRPAARATRSTAPPQRPRPRPRPNTPADLQIGDIVTILTDKGWMEGRIEIIYKKKRSRSQYKLHKLITSSCEIVIGEEGREGWEDIEWQLVETKEERSAREAREDDSDSDSNSDTENYGKKQLLIRTA